MYRLVTTTGDYCPDDMQMILGGNFTMGCTGGDRDCKPNENPAHQASVGTILMDGHEIDWWFLVDMFEVTAEQYAQCVTAGPCKKEHFLTHDQNNQCNLGDISKGDHPMNCVDYVGAQQYCEWAGRRLPTEAEWEYAARGGLDKARYPWGNHEATCKYAVMNDGQGPGCGDGGTAPVGSKAKAINAFELHDMSGNVWEWCADWYGEDYYSSSPSVNPRGPDQGTLRVLRGGGKGDHAVMMRVSHRREAEPGLKSDDVGFRCIMDRDTWTEEPKPTPQAAPKESDEESPDAGEPSAGEPVEEEAQ